jgi:hypothetical protein
MKRKFILFSLSFFIAFSLAAQEKPASGNAPDPSKKLAVVDASCGQCNFGLKGKGCDLAVRLEGKAYFVKGTNINDHGDAHDENGFCNKVRKAEVQGELVKNQFVVTYFKLLPVNGEKK